MSFLKKVEQTKVVATMTHKQLLSKLTDIRHALARRDYERATQVVHEIIDDITDVGGGIRG